MKIKLAIVSTHPIQYFSPWFRHLAEHGESLSLSLSNAPHRKFEFEVFYAHKQTAKGQAEAGFGVEFDWDVPLLEGYPHRFLKNVSQRPGTEWFGGCDCPEIGEILVKEGFTHVLLIGWHKKVFWQAFWAAKKAGIPVFCRGDSQLELAQGKLKRAVKFVAYRFLLPRFDAHLYVGRRNLEYLKHYGVRGSRLFFSPHFVDNEWWSSRAKAADEIKIKMKIKESGVAGSGSLVTGSEKAESENGPHTPAPGPSEPGLRHGEDVRLRGGIQKAEKGVKFLFAGKFIPKKRVMDLLEAAAGIPEARVVLVGDGPLREQLKARAEKPDLKGRVEFVGFKNQKELPAYLAAADCLVLPSDGTETWGLIVNEAMACGKPAIVSEACGCAPDLIVQGETGYSFKLGDVEALADCLRRFGKNRDQDWPPQTCPRPSDSVAPRINENPLTRGDWSGKVRRKVAEYSMVQATEGLMKAIRSN